MTLAVCSGIAFTLYFTLDSDVNGSDNTFKQLVRSNSNEERGSMHVILMAVKVEVTLDQCSNHGLVYPDTPGCECFECYSGTQCETVRSLLLMQPRINCHMTGRTAVCWC